MSTLLKAHYGNSQLTAGQILRDPILFLAFGFGTGLSRYAPGTLGTVAALPLYGLLAKLPFAFYLTATVFSVVIGVYLCEQASRKLAVHDFGGIVWDEIAGFLITMCLVPCNSQTVAAGFVLFRLLDIVKPWPIGWLDRRVHGGLGIMLDDVAAGMVAAGLLALIF